MDQESFRKLLSTSRAAKPATIPANVPAASTKAKSKTKKADPAQPAFKPRAVKADPYRDRASERRHGKASDYAQVEALAEEFAKRNAEKDRAAVEEQRRYLGGDSEHTVLVKGLDFALLEQNKARQAASTEDDDTLEQAFVEGSSSAPKKRTRAELVAELKNKRLKGEAGKPVEVPDASLEEAKMAGKFKPIGFKPIGAESKSKGKKKVIKKVAKKGVEGEVKKKKSKQGGEAEQSQAAGEALSDTKAAPESKPSETSKLPDPETEPVDEDFDIFADAGDYTGVDLGDDDDDESDEEPGAVKEEDAKDTPSEPSTARKWFETDEPPLPSKSPDAAVEKDASPAHNIQPAPEEPEEGEEVEEELPMRLQPLDSSFSIRELLAIDQEEEKREKRKARKEKKKGQVTDSAKLDRDYQRLKAYTEKKGASTS